MRFDAGGLWGSGNVLIERYGDDPAGYSTWEGHALWGANRPGTLERFGGLVFTLTGRQFIDQFRQLRGKG